MKHVVLFFSALSLFACEGLRESFVGARIVDSCDGQWNVCSSKVGCLLGDTSYIEGRFPGTASTALNLFEPSEVTVSFFLSDISAAGEETVINFHEDSCRARVRVPITGKTFVGEFEQRGIVSRKADLSGKGDHLIAISSDAKMKYLLKIDVLPLRLREQQ
jgi:hypothetical protein